MMNAQSKVVQLRPRPFEYLKDKSFVTFDTETTGVSGNSEICEICMIDGDNGEVLLDTLVKPIGMMHPKAQEVHGIMPHELVDAPDWLEVEQQVRALSAGRVGVAYNANFDLKMMVQSCNVRGVHADVSFGFDNFFCAMVEYSKRIKIMDFFKKSHKWVKLSQACSLENIEINDTLHRAKADAMLTHLLVRKLVDELE
jgi:DNA polymerase-3 subunit epsilon